MGRIQAQIDELDQRSTEVNKKRNMQLQSMAKINQKNKERNEAMMDSLAKKATVHTLEEYEIDPFVRKRSRAQLNIPSAKEKTMPNTDSSNLHS